MAFRKLYVKVGYIYSVYIDMNKSDLYSLSWLLDPTPPVTCAISLLKIYLSHRIISADVVQTSCSVREIIIIIKRLSPQTDPLTRN